jgi:hypothetical protein
MYATAIKEAVFQHIRRAFKFENWSMEMSCIVFIEDD